MTERQWVVLCGRSIVMTWLAWQLQKESDLEVVTALEPAETGRILKQERPVASAAAADRNWEAGSRREHPDHFAHRAQPRERQGAGLRAGATGFDEKSCWRRSESTPGYRSRGYHIMITRLLEGWYYAQANTETPPTAGRRPAPGPTAGIRYFSVSARMR